MTAIRPGLNATPAPIRKPRTALQKHVDFFDRNGDGETRVWETYAGCRALGMGRLMSTAAAVVINAALGIKSGSPWYSFLTIQNDGIHFGKHKGDTGIYDQDGNFVQSRFDDMFKLHDTDGDDALNQGEIDKMLVVNGQGKPSTGSKAEFGLLMKLAGENNADGERVLTRQRMQEFYDGSLFYQLAGEKVP
jgi:peroxygenase